MIVEAPVYSMGAILALAGDHLPDVLPHVFFMFHDYSGVEVGKGSEMHSSIVNFQPYFKALLSDVCSHFLTKVEINAIVKGRDLYVPYKTSSGVDKTIGIIERLKVMKAERDKEKEEE